MIIPKNAINWSISTEEQNGLWHLVFDNDNNVAAFFESVGQTSTQKNLFVGTKEECDAFISENNLIPPPTEEDVVNS
jgi:hypothetical protein